MCRHRNVSIALARQCRIYELDQHLSYNDPYHYETEVEYVRIAGDAVSSQAHYQCSHRGKNDQRNPEDRRT